jgi:hypothetical protein
MFADGVDLNVLETLMNSVESEYYKLNILSLYIRLNPSLLESLRTRSIPDQKHFLNSFGSDTYKKQAMDTLQLSPEIREIVAPSKPLELDQNVGMTITIDGDTSHPLVKAVNDLVLSAATNGTSISLSSHRCVFHLNGGAGK